MRYWLKECRPLVIAVVGIAVALAAAPAIGYVCMEYAHWWDIRFEQQKLRWKQAEKGGAE